MDFPIDAFDAPAGFDPLQANPAAARLSRKRRKAKAKADRPKAAKLTITQAFIIKKLEPKGHHIRVLPDGTKRQFRLMDGQANPLEKLPVNEVEKMIGLGYIKIKKGIGSIGKLPKPPAPPKPKVKPEKPVSLRMIRKDARYLQSLLDAVGYPEDQPTAQAAHTRITARLQRLLHPKKKTDAPVPF